MPLLKLSLRFCKLILGLFLYALGIVLTIQANIGYGPWEVFHVGISAVTGISIGTASIIVGLVIVFITILMGEKIGIGTLLNMLLIGFFLDLLLAVGLIPKVETLLAGIPVLILGLYVISLGSYFYIGSGFGAGPRDSLMVALTRRLRWPIGLIRSLIELTATILGWTLGGMVGIGTLISGFAIGFCIHSSFRLLKFDPTKVRHSTLNESYVEFKAALGNK
ncbi:MAG: hypothetical protein RBT73_04540 [Spirochaetia bacterium]|jgi:uncharacterized membrane protein YczE|nr:hypothetical protein [Spirochaetia bacterium]